MWANSPWASRPWASGPEVSSGGSTQTLYPTLFTNTNTFYSPTITPGSVTLSPSLFTNTNTFYAAYVYDPAAAVSTIRYDISTGRLVKIINNYVCISL